MAPTKRLLHDSAVYALVDNPDMNILVFVVDDMFYRALNKVDVQVFTSRERAQEWIDYKADYYALESKTLSDLGHPPPGSVTYKAYELPLKAVDIPAEEYEEIVDELRDEGHAEADERYLSPQLVQLAGTLVEEGVIFD